MTPMFIKALGGLKAACRRYCQVKLELGDGAYSGIANWGGQQHWVEIVVREAFIADYANIRPILIRETGGGVSLKAVLAVATEMASVANYKTGQESRLAVATIVERTGLGERTVQRARLTLKLLRVATEVLRGRLRRKGERMGSWRFQDKSRGWASVWALHPRKPVDNTRISVDGSIQMAPHPRRGQVCTLNSRRELLTTKRSVDKRAASRRIDNEADPKKVEAFRKGLLLAAKWLGNPRTPAWARQHTPRGWTAALVESAAHGWTAADLNETIDAWAKARGITPDPKHPIAFMRWLMKRQDLTFAPHILAKIASDQEKSERERQAREFDAERARYADAAAEDSPGRRAARDVVRRASDKARARKTENLARDNESRPEWITHHKIDRPQ
ncbi:replication protein [Rhodococcus sp. SRB_17]|nr:replication protein [Rhodococcus sp. SRB_17]